MLHLIAQLQIVLPHVLFARGGGGGSGGGGGGGGGGGSGGGSGGGGVIMLGYIPAHFVANWLYKHVSTPAAKMRAVPWASPCSLRTRYISAPVDRTAQMVAIRSRSDRLGGE